MLKIIIGFLSLLLMGVTVLSQEPGFEPATVSSLGKFVAPESAAGIEGIISVSVSVDAAGKVTSVDSIRGPGAICVQVIRPDVVASREAARDAALATRFIPAKSSGVATASQAFIGFEIPERPSKSKAENREAIGVTSAPENRYTIAAPSGERSNQPGETISGGVLNGKAESLPKPPYPPAARAVRASGAVPIQVLVDEDGSVFSARAVAGHPLLRAVSVAAACKAQFQPTRLGDLPVKVMGIITYNFVP